MKPFQEILAKRYAKAFMRVFGDRLNTTMIECLDLLGSYIQKHRYSLVYLQLSALDDDFTKKNFEDLLDHCGVKDLFQTLLDLLIEHNRIHLLPRIILYVARLYRKVRGIIHWTVESPVKLNNDELISLKAFLERRTRKKAVCSLKLTPSLIAGLRVYSSNLGFEYSVRQQLNSIRKKVWR